MNDRPWLRQLYFEPRLAAVFAALAFAGLAMALWFLPVFPNGPRPSGGKRWLAGRHWTRARWAARDARAAETAGNASAAAAAWRASLGHDPECIECERAHLAALLRENPPERASLTNGTVHGLWLLRIGGTNRSDVALMARVLVLHGEEHEALVLMEPVASGFSPADLELYLDTRIAERTFGGTGPLWSRLAAETRRDPAIRLHELAWRIGWGPAGEAPASRREYSVVAGACAARTVARLDLELASAAGDPSGSDDALGRLRGAGADTPRDHARVAGLWRSSGRPDRARAVLARMPRARSADDAADATAMALAVGGRDLAMRWLREAAPRLDRADLWLRWGNLVVEDRDWAGAGELGKRMRDASTGREVLRPFGLFLEVISAEKAGREVDAAMAMRDLVHVSSGDPAVLWMVAGLMVRNGHPREAQPLLAACEGAWMGKPEYWELACRAAVAGGDVESLQKAARRAWELSPGDAMKADRLGAALVALRGDPVDAVRVTLEAVTARPGVARYQATRALALIQLGRDTEALALLAKLETSGPSDPWTRTMIYLGRFEVHARAGDVKAARAEYDRIDSRQLLPPQVIWLEKRFEEITGTSGPATDPKPNRQP